MNDLPRESLALPHHNLRFTVRYFDDDWEEDEELGFEHATCMAVHAAILTWVEALNCPFEPDEVVARRLRKCVEVVVEVERGEEGVPERERACSSGRGGDARTS